MLASQLRQALTREGASGRANDLVAALSGRNAEFDKVWAAHPVGWRYSEQKTLIHPELGELRLHCQSLIEPDQAQTLIVFTAMPGSESDEKLQLLSVIGSQRLQR